MELSSRSATGIIADEARVGAAEVHAMDALEASARSNWKWAALMLFPTTRTLLRSGWPPNPKGDSSQSLEAEVGMGEMPLG